MINILLGTKQNMSTRFNRSGYRIPVTEIVAEPNVVLEVDQTKAKLGFGRAKKVKKPQNSFVKTAGYPPQLVKEVTLGQKVEGSDAKTFSQGDKISVSIFEPGDKVKITGVTKGKGFAGGVKRWGFSGGPKTHGQSDRHRAPGSIGQGTTPGRVYKGKKMAGHMGVSQLTVTGLEVVQVDDAANLLVVKGSIPGPKNGFVIIQKTGKSKKFTPLFDEKQNQPQEEKFQVPQKEIKTAQPVQEPIQPNESSTTQATTVKEEENAPTGEK